jgi:hypothetical protein
MSEEFPFIEAKSRLRKSTLEKATSEIERALSTLSSGRSRIENDMILGYTLPQSVVRADPEKPWALAPPSVARIRRKILETKRCERLDSVFELNQGVTPGGGCLDIFLVGSRDLAEEELIAPVVEAEDVIAWSLESPKKWIIYPYLETGELIDLGDLDFDLDQDQALQKMNELVATGRVKYPRAAYYLIRHYTRLASREAEKRGWKDYGKRWYEYHRPRDPAIMKSHPKIITRRMTRDMQFSLDNLGTVPTDGCIALTLKPKSDWYQRVRSFGLNQLQGLLFCVALLNSSIPKLLVKSSADAWQGEFYQVREDIIGLIPFKMPSEENVEQFQKIIEVTECVLEKRATTDDADHAILCLYDLESERGSILDYIKRENAARSN